MAKPFSRGEKSGERRLYGRYRRQAAKRKIPFSLTFQVFEMFLKKDCFYCGAKPNQVMKKNNVVLFYNGIDRLRNKTGYTKDNCVTCCGNCNQIKSDLSIDKFIHQITQIALNFLGLKHGKK